jgi:light-regulated signal transduction histidine kinase (bacteriophytochrome)
LNEEGRHYLERVRANTERMKRLIEDLLELSRLKKKGSVIEEIPAGDLISEARMRLEYAIKQKNAEIIVQDNLPRVFCDRVRLTEVFLNLISNAIKFNDKPKPVIEIGYSDKGDLYEFYVKDNGTGIEKEYFKKIFEIFQRLGRREDAEGTGAGLTIAKKIVHIHRGNIRVDSKLKEGSVFYFTIPKNKEMVIGKKLIGEILLEKNFISEENLKAALEEQKKSSMPHKKEEDK